MPRLSFDILWQSADVVIRARSRALPPGFPDSCQQAVHADDLSPHRDNEQRGKSTPRSHYGKWKGRQPPPPVSKERCLLLHMSSIPGRVRQPGRKRISVRFCTTRCPEMDRVGAHGYTPSENGTGLRAQVPHRSLAPTPASPPCRLLRGLWMCLPATKVHTWDTGATAGRGRLPGPTTGVDTRPAQRLARGACSVVQDTVSKRSPHTSSPFPRAPPNQHQLSEQPRGEGHASHQSAPGRLLRDGRDGGQRGLLGHGWAPQEPSYGPCLPRSPSLGPPARAWRSSSQVGTARTFRGVSEGPHCLRGGYISTKE